jgi:hypothetical protein
MVVNDDEPMIRHSPQMSAFPIDIGQATPIASESRAFCPVGKCP